MSEPLAAPAAPAAKQENGSRMDRVAESTSLKLFSRLSMAAWSILGTLALSIAGYAGEKVITSAVEIRDSVLKMGWFIQTMQRDVRAVRREQGVQANRIERIENALGIPLPFGPPIPPDEKEEP